MAEKQLNLYHLGERCDTSEDEVVKIEILEGGETTEKTFDDWAALKVYIEGKRKAGYTVSISAHIKSRCGYGRKKLGPKK